MSLKHIAQTVQAQGRGDDTVLIHMTPKEVHGLQALAMSQGGSLTVNPTTGLPEAGFLSSILPTLIGAGLSVASGGTLSPLMAGLLVGGGTGLITGDLKQGLMAGLGGYGGAGLGAGLVGAGANAAQTAAQAGLPAASQGAVGQGLQAAIPSATATEAYQALPWYEQMGQGVTAAFKEPTAAIEAMGGGKKALQYGMAAAAPAALDAMTPTATPVQTDRERYLYQYDRPLRSNGSYDGPYSGERSYFEDGTLTRLAGGGSVEGLARGGFVVPADVVSMLGEGSTDAGLRALQNKYGPAVAPIRGPGTGQSDSIKTSVEGRRPARVADGEAYIPPQVVAKHGGAKKLYSVLDRVRAASQGHTQQQRRVDPRKVLA